MGYAVRQIALRKRKHAGPQPSQPATTPAPGLYLLRVRSTPERRREAWASYIQALRKATGVSRAELARRLGVDPTTVWRWETKRQKPESPDIPLAIAELFSLDADEVMAAAGLKPDTAVSQPTVEVDEELELILNAPVNARMKKKMIERLFELREQDKQRREAEIKWWIEQAGA